MVSKRKLAQEQYEQFKAACKKWAALLGVSDWTLYFRFTGLDLTCYSHVDYSYDDHVATISLNSTLDDTSYDDMDIDRTAFHEVMHLRLIGFRVMEAHRLHESIEGEEHAIIRGVENCLFRGKDAT